MAKKSAVDEQDLEDDEDSDLEGADKDDEDEDEKDGEKDERDGEDAEPKTRSNLASIISRKNRQIEKLKERKPKTDDEDDEDGDVNVDDKVNRAVQKNFAPIAKDLDEKQVGLEISTFLAETRNARFKKFERQARRYALHPAYANVPIDGIFKQLAFDDVDAGGANDQSARQERTQRQNARGNSQRQEPESDSSKIQQMKFHDKGFKSIRQRIAAGETINLAEEE